MKKSFGLLVVLLLMVSGCAKKPGKWELVIQAKKAQLESNQLTLNEVSQRVAFFTKQTPRKARSVSIQSLLENWDQLFAKSKPNAVLTMTESNGQVTEHVVVLQKPYLTGDSLHISIENLNKTTSAKILGEEAILYVDAVSFASCNQWNGSSMNWCKLGSLPDKMQDQVVAANQ